MCRPVCINESEEWKKRRLMQVWMYVRVDEDDDNQFAHPLDVRISCSFISCNSYQGKFYVLLFRFSHFHTVMISFQ